MYSWFISLNRKSIIFINRYGEWLHIIYLYTYLAGKGFDSLTAKFEPEGPCTAKLLLSKVLTHTIF